MCGIVGIVSPDGQPVDTALLTRMTSRLRHRGPDDEGYLFADTRSGLLESRRGNETIPDITEPDVRQPFSKNFLPNLALGWRRLSIIDLSPTGHQPMSNEERTIWIVFNGEIYNYLELREELRSKGHRFRTRSDTEVIVRSYEEWGTECLHHLNGMWGFALYDVSKKILFCARDRFGIKPFYYHWDGTTFLFASETKALLESPLVQRTADEAIVYDYLLHRVLDHGSRTFFKGILQILPGHFLVLDASGPDVRRYYSLPFSPELGSFNEQALTQYARRFRELFSDSVRIHLRTDATLGSCLSGGLDSSSIVCTANELIFGQGLVDRALVGEKQKTFTATYDDERFSEDRFVHSIIAKTGADPHFIKPTGEGLLQELSAFVRAHDEPVVSTSVYAQWNVMKLAAQNGVKVLLDGQGGDELLAGYRWHYPLYHAQLFSNMRFGLLLHEILKTSDLTGTSVAGVAKPFVQKFLKPLVPTAWREKFSPLHRYLRKDFLARGGPRNSVVKSDRNLQQRLWEEETRFNLQQLLHYEDRNSMAFSVEARVPFVEHHLIEFVMSVPAVYKIHDGWSKFLLRAAMEGLLPEEIRWRKDKMGFVTPEEQWMRVHRSEFHSLLESSPLRAQRFLDAQAFLDDLAKDTTNLPADDLWRLINLELWMRTFDVSS